MCKIKATKPNLKTIAYGNKKELNYPKAEPHQVS